jgi:hypothetical protein
VLARVRQRPTLDDAPSGRAGAPPGEPCDLCGELLPAEHRHLVDLEARSLRCACRGCWLLFTPRGAGGGHYRAVPERYAALPGVCVARQWWESLAIPVSVAFFFRNSQLDRLCAFYPSPAGATESTLALGTWEELVAANPSLADLEADVEALLVRSEPRGDRSPEGFVVPIDACYELVGRLRLLWRGFDGGGEARAALDTFFADVRRKAGAGP